MGTYGLSPSDIAHELITRDIHYMEGDFTPLDFIRGAMLFLQDVQDNEGHPGYKVWDSEDWRKLIQAADLLSDKKCQHNFKEYGNAKFCQMCGTVVLQPCPDPPKYCDDCGVDHGTGITCPEDGGTRSYSDTCDMEEF